MEGRPTVWKAGRPDDRQDDWQGGRKTGRQRHTIMYKVGGRVYGLTGRPPRRLAEKQPGRPEDTQAGRKAEGQAARNGGRPECNQAERKSAKHVGIQAGSPENSQARRACLREACRPATRQTGR